MAVKKLPIEKDETEKVKCLKCKKLKVPNVSNFYANTNQLFSSDKFEICKDCIQTFIGEKGTTGYLDRVVLTLALLDKPLVGDLWVSRDEEWSRYIPQASSFQQYQGMKFSDSTIKTIDVNNINTEKSEHSEFTGMDTEKFYNKKWMGEYTSSDIEYMEDYYIGLDRDFKIATTSHKDYARKICKASLHMDRCFQEVLSAAAGADARYKSARETFDTLSKSAQFSESQRGQNDVGLGGYGVTFDQVEQRKWVPKHTPLEQDSYDKMLNQFSTIKESV